MIATLRRMLPLLLAAVLTACGGEPAEETNAAAPAPISYAINPADLHRSTPNDICRARDPNFLEALISRARGGVPSAQLAQFRFEDFNVTDGYEGKGREAILRFRVAETGDPQILMYAVGPFDPLSCAVGQLRVGVGASPYEESGRAETRLP